MAETERGIPHRLTLEEREKLTMSGVTDVESFDEDMIVLHTSCGTAVVRGSRLHLQMLSPEGGQVAVDGTVDSIAYEPDAPAGGLLSRLFG